MGLAIMIGVDKSKQKHLKLIFVNFLDPSKHKKVSMTYSGSSVHVDIGKSITVNYS